MLRDRLNPCWRVLNVENFISGKRGEMQILRVIIINLESFLSSGEYNSRLLREYSRSSFSNSPWNTIRSKQRIISLRECTGIHFGKNTWLVVAMVDKSHYLSPLFPSPAQKTNIPDEIRSSISSLLPFRPSSDSSKLVWSLIKAFSKGSGLRLRFLHRNHRPGYLAENMDAGGFPVDNRKVSRSIE